MDIIKYDNYEFTLEILQKSCSIILYYNDEIYGNIINEDDRYINPISKFYSMIIKALNKEANYSIDFLLKNDKIICTIQYTCDILEIEEPIVLMKGLVYQQIKKLYDSNKALENKLIESTDENELLNKELRSNKHIYEQKMLEKDKDFIRVTTDTLPKSSKTINDFKMWNDIRINSYFKNFHTDEFIIGKINRMTCLSCSRRSPAQVKLILATNYGKIILNIKTPDQNYYSDFGSDYYLLYDFDSKLSLKLLKVLISIITPTETNNYGSCTLHHYDEKHRIYYKLGLSTHHCPRLYDFAEPNITDINYI